MQFATVRPEGQARDSCRRLAVADQASLRRMRRRMRDPPPFAHRRRM
jgi:hypothetical protein